MTGEGIAAEVEISVGADVDSVGTIGVSVSIDVGDGVSVTSRVSVAVGISDVADCVTPVIADVGVIKNDCTVLHPSKNTKNTSRAIRLMPNNHGITLVRAGGGELL